MDAVQAGIVAVLFAALLVIAVDAAGGWRRVRPVTAADEASVRPATDVAGLDQEGWRVRTVADVLQLVLVVALGLTPVGARFVHLVAPNGDTWHAAAAWLLILAGVTAVARLPMMWWRRQMRQTRPELFRPRGGPRQRLARAAIIAFGLLGLALWVFELVVEVRGDADSYLGLSLAVVVTTWLQVLIRSIRRQGMSSGPGRLSDIVASLPGGPRVRVVSAWPGAVANAKVAGLRRPVIVVAPPIAAALTDTELRAVLAHEVAHVQHGDVRRRVLRRILMNACVLAGVAALYGIPALHSLAGLQGPLSVQAGPFLLALWYLVFRVLRAMELRATRAEERAADQGMISLTGDPDACADGLGKLSALLGTPDAWTVPQRLLFASHPATRERLRFLRDPAPDADVRPRAAAAGRVQRRGVLAGVLVVGAVLAISGVSGHQVTAGAKAMPADAGKYRVLLPRSLDSAQLDEVIDAAPLDTASADAVQLRSSVWGSGGIRRFPDAVPVTGVYDQSFQSWIYVWGAYGKITDPARELSAAWSTFDPQGFQDPEPTGRLGGYLQCDDGIWTCAWADNSAIVVVSLAPPAQDASGVVATAGLVPTEQELAAITLSIRSVGEVASRPLARS